MKAFFLYDTVDGYYIVTVEAEPNPNWFFCHEPKWILPDHLSAKLERVIWGGQHIEGIHAFKCEDDSIFFGLLKRIKAKPWCKYIETMYVRDQRMYVVIENEDDVWRLIEDGIIK